MEKIVQAVVQDQQGRFAVVMTPDDQMALPTCVVDVGASFDKAALLIEAPVKVELVANLGFDPDTNQHYYFGEARKSDSTLGIHWRTARDILQQPVHPSFGPVRNYLNMMAATREVA
jgi:hypothetical protein